MFRQLQSAAIIADMTTPRNQFKWTAFKIQSQTVRGEFQLFSSVSTSFPRHPRPCPSTLAFPFDLDEPVTAYVWNLKLRTWPLVVTGNHRAFVVRAGFQLRRHGYISLGIAAFWDLRETSLGSGLSRLLLPHATALQTQHRGETQAPTQSPAGALVNMGYFDTVIDKTLSLCRCTSCARSHWHFQFCRKERISSAYKLLKETSISVTSTRGCIEWMAWYFVTRLPAEQFFWYEHGLKACVFEHSSVFEKWFYDYLFYFILF